MNTNGILKPWGPHASCCTYTIPHHSQQFIWLCSLNKNINNFQTFVFATGVTLVVANPRGLTSPAERSWLTRCFMTLSYTTKNCQCVHTIQK
jgi:hypothetical protein